MLSHVNRSIINVKYENNYLDSEYNKTDFYITNTKLCLE